MATHPIGRIVWSHQGPLAGTGTVAQGTFDVHDVSDLWLAANLAGPSYGSSPTLTVQVDVLDNLGDVIATMLAVAESTSALGHAPASKAVHIGDLTLPTSCQVSYIFGGTGPAFSNVDLTLVGR
jgi:hypothetical protein